ncbi:ABC transporter permease [Amycolatopsis suaedae]|uniref:ABC transporter permease n=1 Tax=Amycolatopsis suaedae TaxID=2510978 RepID=A0A4Q7JAF4_9PSEU|nr:ABC transporter permease [Amycolatopsis suaedae]RZQ63453.1 ABC transporter permease [Amycolatopsis suaedae]
MTDPNAATAGETVQAVTREGRPRGLFADAWYELRRRPMFWLSATLILLVLLMAAFPQLFTSVDPNYADLSRSRQPPSGEAWFGYDNQGGDVYARTIHGARASLLVGLLATAATVLLGATLGVLAGYHGGWLDTVLSRISDIFVGLPFVLGAIVILYTFNTPGSTPSGVRVMTQVVLSIAVLAWPVAMRIMRSATITAKQQDYVKAARALGAGPGRVIVRHMLPNTVAPVLVYATIALGAFIGVEATLSFLGVGLRPPVVSWGVMISAAKDYIRVAPHMLLFPAGFLTLTVLAFVTLGDAVREALDPKLR